MLPQSGGVPSGSVAAPQARATELVRLSRRGSARLGPGAVLCASDARAPWRSTIALHPRAGLVVTRAGPPPGHPAAAARWTRPMRLDHRLKAVLWEDQYCIRYVADDYSRLLSLQALTSTRRKPVFVGLWEYGLRARQTGAHRRSGGSLCGGSADLRLPTAPARRPHDAARR